jgi:CpeT protein
MIKSALLFCFVLTSLTLFSQPREEMNLMADWFTGEFSTKGETLIDATSGHQQIRVVRIWESREDLWVYYEQSKLDSAHNPHRQWIFAIEEEQENLYLLQPHRLPNMAELKGNRSQAFLENHIDISDLEEIGGCELFVEYDGFASFTASTVEDYCDTKYQGADILHIKFNLMEDKFDWWEKGFDENGKQLWGAGKDPQVFRKVMDGKK